MDPAYVNLSKGKEAHWFSKKNFIEISNKLIYYTQITYISSKPSVEELFSFSFFLFLIEEKNKLSKQFEDFTPNTF